MIHKIIEILLNPFSMILGLFADKLELNIAKKYVFQFRREFSFISVITFISFIGITLGIAALIAVISIFNGFRDFAMDQLISFDPHIRVISKSDTASRELNQFLNQNRNLLDYSPAIHGKLILKNNDALQVGILNALDTGKIRSVSGISDRIVAGQFNVSYTDIPNIILGAGLADKISALPGDTIFALSPDIIEQSVKSLDNSPEIPIRVSGIFLSYSKEYDDNVAFASLDFGKEIFFKSNSAIQNFDIRLKDFSDCDDFAEQIRSKFPKIEVLTWYDLHSDMFNIMKLERMMVFIVLSLIIVIAVFNLLASMTMSVIEKQRDIAILKSIGADNKSVRKIFLLAGAYIGLLAVFWGNVLGLGFCYGQIYFNWFQLDTSKYLIRGIPITIDYYNILIIDIFAVFLSFVSTLIPAKYAANQSIVKFLKNN